MKKIVTLLSFVGLGGAHGFVFTAGELDFGVIFDGSGLELEAHVVNGTVNNSPTVDVEYEVGDLTVVVGADREFVAPVANTPIGVLGGDPVWILPNSNIGGVPFVALASEELVEGGGQASDWNGFISFALGQVTSPSGNGDFSASLAEGTDPEVFYFSTADPSSTANNNVFVSEFGHDHFLWYFTEPGIWEIEMTASGERVTSEVLTDTRTLRFNVIPEPSTGLMVLLSVAGVSLVRRRQ